MQWHQTQAIVITRVKYSETSIIAKLFTQKFGLVDILVKGVRAQKAKFNQHLFNPFSLLYVQISNSEKTSLQFLKEAFFVYPDQAFISNPIDDCLKLFYCDLLKNCLKNNEADNDLYLFLLSQQHLITLTEIPAYLKPLIFTYGIIKQQGFEPQINQINTSLYYNKSDGSFNYHKLGVQLSLPEAQALFYLNSQISNLHLINKPTANKLLSLLIEYWQVQNQHTNQLKSIEVLKSIFN